MTQTWPCPQGAWRLLGQADSIASDPSVVSAAVVGITGTARSPHRESCDIRPQCCRTGRGVHSGLRTFPLEGVAGGGRQAHT